MSNEDFRDYIEYVFGINVCVKNELKYKHVNDYVIHCSKVWQAWKIL